MEEKVAIAKALGIYEELDLRRIRDEYEGFAERIRPMVRDTATLLNQAIRDGKTVLFEGAQGTMLDIDHGTYPFVTSSSASAGGACTGTGVAPTRIGGVIGFPRRTLRAWAADRFPPKHWIRRARRSASAAMNSAPSPGGPALRLVRRSAAALHRAINGFDSLVITKLDVLDELESIPVCTGYRVGALEVAEMPPTVAVIEKLEPVYEYLPGWRAATFGVSSYDDLPQKAKDYLAFLESRTGVEVGCISTGPERNQTIVRPGSRFEELVGCASSL